MITMNIKPLAILSLLKYFQPWQNCSIIGEQIKKKQPKNQTKQKPSKQNESKHQDQTPKTFPHPALRTLFFLVTSMWTTKPVTELSSVSFWETEEQAIFCFLVEGRQILFGTMLKLWSGILEI